VVVVQFDTDPTIPTRNRVVYNRPLKLYQGVDNIVKIQVLNSDQKPVDITDYTVTFNLIDSYVYANANVVLSSQMTVSNARSGLGSVTIGQLELLQLNSLDRQDYTYNLLFNNGSANVAAYVDDNYGVSGQVEINPSGYAAGAAELLDFGSVADPATGADFGTI